MYPITTNFTAGELSPRLLGRVDVERYYSGCETLENFTVFPHGGAKRRAGTRFIAEVKDSTKDVRLIPFSFNREQSYVLEFGDQYIRFFANYGQLYSGATIYEVASPYTEAQIWDVKWAQDADVMYLAHPNVRPYKLSRLAHTNWTCATYAFTSAPAEWTGTNWPGAVTFYEGRLWFAGTPDEPLKIYASRSQSYDDFTTGADDDHAILFAIAAAYDRIAWLVPHQRLIAGTLGAEFTCGARSSLDPITPTNVRAEKESVYGTNGVQAELVNNAVLAISRSGRKIREYAYAHDSLSYRGKDLTLYSEHITGQGVTQISWAQDPDALLYAIRTDGVMLVGTYYPAEAVLAWCRLSTDGLFLSVASIPAELRDETYVLVEREIDGSDVKYVEYFDQTEFTRAEEMVFIDSALSLDDPFDLAGASKTDPVIIETTLAHGFIDGDEVRIIDVTGMTEINDMTYTVASATTMTFALTDAKGDDVDGTGYTTYESGGEVRLLYQTISGLDHLEGETLQVLADGARQPDVTVSSGQVALARPASWVHLGLQYISTLKTLPVELQDDKGGGTSQTRMKRINQIAVKFYETTGGQFGSSESNLQDFPIRSTDSLMDTPIDPLTGHLTQTFPGGYESDGSIIIRQNAPFPMTVLAIVPSVEVYDQ